MFVRPSLWLSVPPSVRLFVHLFDCPSVPSFAIDHCYCFFFLSFNIVKGRKFNVTTASTAVRISDFNFAVLLMLVAMVVVLMAATYQTRRDILTRIGE